ncbi:hypothetical protein PHYPSEUDO_015415 [Phytophthora pseudosyringae]|uniref:Ras-GAP domain-containing protein n=1 Tax=Phytophthora pseudosyringae TaxID=221518 RepID=A0A8T1VZR6_9STRA|nr:hypothetical protein PHYPSEUDO_015415 [Phytophthora pseudosyringae]
MHKRDLTIANFLHERAAWQPMCLYTFDGPAITNRPAVMNRVPDEACPFDALQPEDELVTSLNTPSSFWQLGVHLEEAPSNDSRRVQLSSISSVSARDFFTMAAVRNNTASGAGVTFEMVIRRRAKANRSMTLFSIANEYDNCVDPGFRLDVNEHQVLAFIYFLPVLEEGGEAGVEACYEQRLFSVDNSAACQLPPLLDPVERTPPVQIIVTLDPSSERGLWKTDFYMSYTDAHTMQRVDCVVHDEQHPPSTQLLSKLIEGRYRLFLGNSPRNVTSPRQRKRLAPARGFQSLGNTSNRNATERLRVMLKQKLTSISGPRLPKAMRIFGDNSLSLHILGITFPPLNEDTPLAYLRSKLADFKEQHGDQIVDYLVNLVQQKVKGPVVTQRGQTPSDQGSGEFSRAALFQGAGDATFDLFHFAIYRRVVSEEQVNSLSRRWLLPSRPFPAQQVTVRVPEDSMVLLNLTMLHGVFDDLRLELRDIPEFGRLLLVPNKTVVTSDNRDLFRELPLEYQRSIVFQPESDQNNENLPLPNPVAFSRRLEPYATVRFGIVDSLAGRVVNKSSEARIDIFVDAVNDAPRPRKAEMEIRVEVGFPVPLDLKGDDVDGAIPASVSKTGATGSSDFLSSFSFSNDSTGTTSLQLLKIARMPQFGKLFDCNASCGTLDFAGNPDVESTRVYRNSTDIVNATHSTSLVYIYHGWGQEHLAQNGSTPIVVDELWYKLSDGDPDIISDVAVIKFILVSRMEDPVSRNSIAVARLKEDSLQILNLGILDPLAAFFNARTRFKVTVLPRQGALFQYNDDENDDGSSASTSLEFIGACITAPNTIIADLWGRVFFVPKPDYFNMESQRRVLCPDYFEYQVVNATPLPNDSFLVYEKSPAARFVNRLESRRVELEVENVPDALVVVPPFTFTANKSNGDAIPTPTVFEDPDSTNPNDTYQVNLEAEDGASKFELGFAITDDDVMSGCPFERPCTLIRSTNGARVNVSSSSTRDDELQFHIISQLYDPSHIQVTGAKTALSMALSALTFRDLSGISLDISHEAGFTLWVKRINVDNGSDADILQTQAAFTISFSPDSQSGSISGENLGSVLNSQLERYISTLFFLVAGWLVLSSTSCLSIGFCCCCCAKARKKRRQKFEQEQRHFQAQVAQNDHEYTVLLVSLANTLLEPNLLASRCVLECCITSKYKRKQTEILTQAFIWRSLQPLLESERQGTRFVFQLLAIGYSEGVATTRGAASRFQHEGFLAQGSTASRALACFCRAVGSPWISALLAPGDDTGGLYLGDELSELDSLLDRLATQADALPTELVILCRACAKLFRNDEDDQSCEMELDAVHLVVFNHFLGPALLFPLESVSGFTPSTEQRNTLRALAYRIVGFADQWSSCDSTKADAVRSRSSSTDTLLCPFPKTQRAAACRYKYEAVLETVSRSSTLTSAYDPSEPATDVDCELLGMCLMNIHSLLDGNFPEFKRRLLQTRTSTNVEQIEDTIARSRRLVQALSWPLASIHELVEYARPELLSDPLLWIGLSFQEWQDRARPQQQQHRVDELSHDEDVILEQDGRSPHDVDWLSSLQHS